MSDQKLFLKPAKADLKVPFPFNQETGRRFLDAAGEQVEDNAHWRRRLAAGEVVTAELDDGRGAKPSKK